MNALGMIETKGLVPAIEACDIMLKTADVKLVGKRKSTAALVTILIRGDVAAVKASVDAGAKAADTLTPGSVLTAHVIARPIDDIDKSYNDELFQKQPLVEVLVESTDDVVINEVELSSPKNIDEDVIVAVLESDDVKINSKADLDALSLESDEANILKALDSLTVSKLRKLIRQYEEISLSGRKVSSCTKDELISCLYDYYLKK